MKLVLHPAVEPERLAKICEAAGSMTVVNAHEEAEALHEMPDADAFFGKLTPSFLAAASKLRWVQSPTASLEHFVFPGIDRTSLPVDQHARTVLRCDRRSRLRLHSLLRPQTSTSICGNRPLDVGSRSEARWPAQRLPPGLGRSVRLMRPICTWPIARWASWVWAASARKSPGADWRLTCACWRSIPCRRRRRRAWRRCGPWLVCPICSRRATLW